MTGARPPRDIARYRALSRAARARCAIYIAQNILADSVLGRLMGLSEDLTVEQQKVFTKDGGGGGFETW